MGGWFVSPRMRVAGALHFAFAHIALDTSFLSLFSHILVFLPPFFFICLIPTVSSSLVRASLRLPLNLDCDR